ncbi:DUF2231 domain-containing protein [Sulfurovum sp. NBC37-1]|uniref:DUF2231 domain-containing protein n=1 Tax=Sulfurovum sp. (strain NBC37-1) TaxID=387093 RepID=UPI0001587B3A|nr:DUF2231 domain-containing protein [Sulfurovum sp. NBC37-1]BAF72795.1 conserved hypothetical protein [Sulfurovum sp. NBC37-1]
MELPTLPFKIPEIPLPFDIPALMHPPVDHFIIALPIVVLLLEIINLFTKKRAIGMISFFLLILTVVAAIAAYLTGSADGKHAWDLLSEAGQADLKAHKTLGTYLMLASGIVLVFKLFSAIINRGMMKALYLLVLILFVVGILKQGKEGGELVYTYGANVKIVKTKDDELFDCKDDLSDYIAEEKEAEEEAKAAAEAKKTEESAKPEDSVSKEESAAIATPEAVKDHTAAAAEVEEAASKEAFETKEDSANFKSEAQVDEKKEIAPAEPTKLEDSVSKEESAAIAAPEAVKDHAAASAEVEEAASKEAFDTKEDSANFKSEAQADEKKEIAPAE